MAYDEQLVGRIRKLLQAKKLTIVEKPMFGGITFMVNGNMAVGVTGDGRLMARVGKEQHEKAIKLPHAKPMDFTGKPMVGFIFVEKEGVKGDADLSTWIEMCLAYNKTLPKK